MAAAAVGRCCGDTRFGTPTRAVVDNPDLSDMIGVHGDNVRRVAWILSSVFAALVGILISPTQGLDVNQLVLVVIYAFAPAVLGHPLRAAGGLRRRARRWGSPSASCRSGPNSGTVSNLEAALPYLALFVLLDRLRHAAQVGGLGRRGATAVRVALVGRRSAACGGAWGRCASSGGWRSGLGGFVLALLVPLAFPGPTSTS